MLKNLTAFIAILSLAAAAAAQQRSQADLVATLRSGTPTEREAAIDRAAEIPPDERDTALWLALVHELERVSRESEAREDALAAGKESPTHGRLGGAGAHYVPDLIGVVAEWKDIRVLPALIAAPADGMIVTEPIVKFGDAAVPSLLDAVRRGRRSNVGGALLALQYLLEGMHIAPYNITPAELSSRNRNDIVRLARDLLRPKGAYWPHLPIVAGLALATGDADLRRQVELLASEPGIVSQVTGLVDAQSIDLVQHGIAARLKQHQ